jgi:hypothetical protein
VQQSEKIREKVKKFCNCLVPNITYCVQGLSCPGLVMSMVFVSRVCLCTECEPIIVFAEDPAV